jgi:hypothetical protein
MLQPESKKSFTFDRPGNYRIRVQGFLDKKWSERLGGFHITTSKTGDQKSVTVLKGQVSDQAELGRGVEHTLPTAPDASVGGVSKRQLVGRSKVSGVRCQVSGVRCQKTEVRRQKLDGRGKATVIGFNGMNSIYFIERIERHAAHTPALRKHLRFTSDSINPKSAIPPGRRPLLPLWLPARRA